MSARITETYAIMDRAVETYKPSTIVASYSGGYDSMVMSHIAIRWAQERGYSNLVMCAVDTLIHADGWREFILESAAQLGSPRTEIWDNPDLDKWTNDVKTYGFVYNDTGHVNYFYYLKQRVFRAIQAHYKTHRHDNIMFLNGIRQAESRKRRNAPEVAKYGSGIHVNPVLYWTDDNILDYRTKHELPINPFYDRVNNSGDCLCNWHNRISLTRLKKYATEAAKIILPLDEHNRQQFGYGYDEDPKTKISDNQMRLFEWDTNCTPNLCDGCNRPDADNDAADFLALQRMGW